MRQKLIGKAQIERLCKELLRHVWAPEDKNRKHMARIFWPHTMCQMLGVKQEYGPFLNRKSFFLHIDHWWLTHMGHGEFDTNPPFMY